MNFIKNTFRINKYYKENILFDYCLRMIKINRRNRIITFIDGQKFIITDVGDYQLLPAMYEKVNDLVNMGDIVIDIGSYLGMFGLLSSKKAKMAYLFEPLKSNFDIMKKNLELNKINNAIISSRAVWKDENKVRLFNDFKDQCQLAPVSDESEMYESISLKKIFQDNKIKYCDVMKINCEGSEFDIFYNTPKEILKRIGIIDIQIHGKKDKCDKLYNFLCNLYGKDKIKASFMINE